MTMKHLLTLLLALTITLGMSSCKKEKPTTAKIYAVDQTGAAVVSAEVVLTAEPTETSSQAQRFTSESALTNIQGLAEFDFSDYFELGQAGLFVLKISVKTGGVTIGSGVIQIEEEKTNEATIVVN